MIIAGVFVVSSNRGLHVLFHIFFFFFLQRKSVVSSLSDELFSTLHNRMYKGLATNTILCTGPVIYNLPHTLVLEDFDRVVYLIRLILKTKIKRRKSTDAEQR